VGGGHLSERKAQNHISALKGLASVLEPDEPTTINGVAAILDTLPARWARKNDAKDGSTAGTYRTNGRWLLDRYLDWCRDPEKFDTATLGGRRSPLNGNGNGNGNPKAAKPASATPARSTMPRKKKDDGHRIACALGAKGTADLILPFPAKELTLPELSSLVCQLASQIEGFNMRDAATLASHLATRTPDFDPRESILDQLFGRPGPDDDID
jgi:hypothetical protein